MRQRRDQPTYGPAARVLSVALLAGSLALTAQQPAVQQPDLTGPVELALARAEQALEDQELQLAESHYRDALLECWLLMSSLETADGDLTAAHDALEASTRAAVTSGSPAADTAVAGLSEAERGELRVLLEATLGQVYRNLSVLYEQSRRPKQAATHLVLADALGTTEKAVLGSLDLRASPPSADLVVGPLGPDEETLSQVAGVHLEPIVQLIRDGRLKKAERALRKILKAGDDPYAGDMLAIFLAARGQYDEAEEQLAKAIAVAFAAALAPDKAAAQEVSYMRQHLARLHLMRGDEEKAAEELRTAAELGALDRDLGLKLAELEVASRDAPAARRVLQVLTYTYSSPRVLLKLAELTWRTGPPNSLPILLQARELAPNSEEVLGNTANAYLAADEPEKALEVLAPLMTMHPDIVVYVRLLAEAYTKLERLDEAAAALRQAIALEPSSLRNRVRLAGVLLNQKHFDAAEAELREILAIDPERPDAKDLLVFLEEERGRSSNGE